MTYHCRNNIDNDVMKEIHLKIVLYHRVSTTTTVRSAKEEREISKTAEAGARIAYVSPRQTGRLFFLFVCVLFCTSPNRLLACFIGKLLHLTKDNEIFHRTDCVVV